jgi:phosphoglycerol transferase MdoB-like AlkP superfamily enzyme
MQSHLLNIGLLFIPILLLLAVFLRSDIAIIVPAVICFLFFTLNEFVVAFRGTPVTPADIGAAKTAFTVSGEYKFFVNSDMLSSLNFLVLFIILSRLFNLRFKKHPVALRIVFAAVMIAICVPVANINKLIESKTLLYDGFAVSASNQNFGMLSTFYLTASKMFVSPPEDYSNEAAEEILANAGTTQGTELSPNVIVIMNESFCDYGKFIDVQPLEDPLPYWHSLTDNAVDGDLLVPVTGGGTSYTEYEMLSGLGGGIFKSSFNPYARGIKKHTYSIAWDFKKLGYTNIAIHPFWASCWNRATVYPNLGFDDFISGEDFAGKQAVDNDSGYIIDSTDMGDIDYVRDYASDKESFNKIIEQLQNKNDGEKLFVFNVTIQNHGGYSYEGDNFEYKITSKNHDSTAINQYLSLLKYTDDAYKELIEYLKDYPEPTVVLMFGDHQPGIVGLDPTEQYAYLGDYAAYITNYKIWANYPLPDDLTGGTTSSELLSLKLKQAAGLPLNEWDCFRQKLNEHFLGVSFYDYAKDKDDTIVYGGELTDDEKKMLDDYKILEYYLFFKQGLVDKN